MMKKFFTRVTGMLMAALMLLSVLPMGVALAAEPEEEPLPVEQPLEETEEVPPVEEEDEIEDVEEDAPEAQPEEEGAAEEAPLPETASAAEADEEEPEPEEEPLVKMSAEEFEIASDEHKNVSNTSNETLSEMGFAPDMDKVSDTLDKTDVTPLGTGISRLKAVDELFAISGHRDTLWTGTTAQKNFNHQRAALYDYKGLTLSNRIGNAKNADMLDDSTDNNKFVAPGFFNKADATANTLAGAYDFVRSSAFDPNGVGRNTHVAQVVGKVYSSTGTEMCLRVVNIETQAVVATQNFAPVPFRMFNNMAGAYLVVETGDYNGDGKEEIAVYEPYQGLADSVISMYTLNGSSLTFNKSFRLSGTSSPLYTSYEMKFDGVANTMGTGKAALIEFPVVDMATVRQPEDRGGADDLVITVSYSREIDDRTKGTALHVTGKTSGTNTTNDGRTTVAARIMTWIDPLTSTGTMKKVGGLNNVSSALTWSWDKYGQQQSGKYLHEVMMSPGVGAADLTGDGKQEVVVAGYRLEHPDINIGGNDNTWNFSKGTLLATYLNYNNTTKSYSVAQLPNWVSHHEKDWGGTGKAATEMNLALGDTQNLWDLAVEPPPVVGFAERGTGLSDSVLINSVVTALASQTGGYNGSAGKLYPNHKGYPTYGHSMTDAVFTTLAEQQVDLFTARYAIPTKRMDDDGDDEMRRTVMEAVAGNFDGNASGVEQVAFTYTKRRDSTEVNEYKSYIGMFGAVDASDIKYTLKANTGGFFAWTAAQSGHKVSAPASIAAVDPDNDSTMVRYAANKSSDYYFSDPQPEKVLQAAPYFEELGLGEGNTRYYSTKGTGHGTQHAASVSAGVSVGFEQTTSLLGMFDVGGFSAKVSASISAGYANEISCEAVSIIGNNASGEDVVVLSMVPYVRYYYEVRDNDTGEWVPTVVDCPQQTLATQIPVDMYDEMAERSGWQPIRGTILTGTPGDPSTYPASIPGFVDELGWKSSPTTGSSIDGERSFNSDTSHSVTWGASGSVEVNYNVMGLVVGATAGVEYTGGHTWSSSDGHGYAYEIAGTGNSAYKFQFAFGHYRRNLRTTGSSKKSVEVVGYKVKDVSVGRPKAPTDLHVTDLDDNNVTLAWSRAGGKVDPQYYTVMRGPTTAPSEIGIVAANDQERFLNGSLYNLTDTRSGSGMDRSYNVKSYGLVGGSMKESVPGKGMSTEARVMTPDSSILIITTHPQDTPVKLGGTATFTVAARRLDGRAEDFSYQWEQYSTRNGWTKILDVPGASTLSLGGVTSDMDGTVIRCMVTSPAEDMESTVAYSNPATLTVARRTMTMDEIKTTEGGETITNDISYKYASGMTGRGNTFRVATSSSAGDTVILTTTFSNHDTAVPPTGRVEFSMYNSSTGETSYHYANLVKSGSKYKAELNWKTMISGQYHIRATYEGDKNYAPVPGANVLSLLGANPADKYLVAFETSYTSEVELYPKGSMKFDLVRHTLGTYSQKTASTYIRQATFKVQKDNEKNADGTPAYRESLIGVDSNSYIFKPTEAGRYTISYTNVFSGNKYTATIIVTMKPAELVIRAKAPKPVTESQLKAAGAATTLLGLEFEYDTNKLTTTEVNAVKSYFDCELAGGASLGTLGVGTHKLVPECNAVEYDKVTGKPTNLGTTATKKYEDLIKKASIIYEPAELVVIPDEPLTAQMKFTHGENGTVTAKVSNYPVVSGQKVLVGEAKLTAIPREGYTVDKWTGATPDGDNSLKATAQVKADGSTQVHVTFKPGEGNAIINVGISPTSATVYRGASQTFTAEVNASGTMPKTVDWRVYGQASSNTKVEDGVLTVGADETANKVTVRAISTEDNTKYGEAIVAVTDRPLVLAVGISPTAVSVQRGTSQQFSTFVQTQGTASQAVNWSVSGNDVEGTTISNGLLTVAADETAATLTVTATSAENAEKSATATVTLTDEEVTPAIIGVRVEPKTATVRTGENQQFTALVDMQGAPDATVDWTLTGNASAETTLVNGLLTVAADETATTLTVKATSRADTGKSSSATVTVQKVPVVASVTVAPDEAEVEVGESQAFTAEVKAANGAPTTVSWTLSGNTSEDTYLESNGNETELIVGSDEGSVALEVTATSTFNPDIMAVAKVTVPNAVGQKQVLSVTVDPPVDEVVRGKALQFAANVRTTDPSVKTGVTWSVLGKTSSGTTISKAGLLKVSLNEKAFMDDGVTPRVLTVIARSTADNTKAGEAQVLVLNNPRLTGVSIAPTSMRVLQGESGQLKVRPNAGAQLLEADYDWSSSDNGVVSVQKDPEGDTATVTGNSVGRATITATVNVDGQAYTAQRTVEVVGHVTGVTISDAEIILAPSQDYELSASLQPAGGVTDPGNFQWSSSDARIATVQDDGRVIARSLGEATITVATLDMAHTASCKVTVKRPTGQITLSPTSVRIPLDGGASVQATLHADTPEELAMLGELEVALLETDGVTLSDVAIVDDMGGGLFAFTPQEVGTAYLHVTASGNPGVSVRCRVDVYDPAEVTEMAKRHLGASTVTVYKRSNQPVSVPVLLAPNGLPWDMTTAAGTLYEFTGNQAGTLGSAFGLGSTDDGTLMLSPLAGLADLPAGKYTTGFSVTLNGQPASSELLKGTLTIDVKGETATPKLALVPIAFNSFYAQSSKVVVDGLDSGDYTLDLQEGKDDDNNKLLGKWFTYEEATDTLSVIPGVTKKSGKLYFTVKLSEAKWQAGTEVNVALSVSNVYTTPQLKLNQTSVNMYETAQVNQGAVLSVLPKAAYVRFKDIGITNLQVIPFADMSAAEQKNKAYSQERQDAYEVLSFSRGSGEFTLGVAGGYTEEKLPAGKVLLGVQVSGAAYLVRIPVTVKLIKPGTTIKLTSNATKITLNQNLSPAQSYTFRLGTNAKGFPVNWKDIKWTVMRGKSDVTDLGELDVLPLGNTLEVTTTRNTEANATYKITVKKDALYQKNGVDKQGKIDLTVKTLKTTANASVKLTAKGSTDLTTGAMTVITAKFTNYYGQFNGDPRLVTAGWPKNVVRSEYFDFEPMPGKDNTWRVVPKAGMDLTPGTYKVKVDGGALVADGVNVTSKTVSFKVTASKPKIKVAPTSVTMYATDRYDKATVNLALPANMPEIKSVKLTGTAAKLYDVALRGDDVEISFKQEKFDAKKLKKGTTLTIEVRLDGNTKAATKIKAKVVIKKA